MTSLQKSFMEVPLKNLTEIYNNEVVPRLTKKNKVIAISAAIILMVTYKLNGLLRPPRKLRHIPHQGYFSFLVSLFRKETVLERSQRYALPQIDSAESNGLYLRSGRFGWEVQITNPEAVKRVFLKQDLYPKNISAKKFHTSLGYKFVGRPNIALLNGEHWKAQRKIANPAFHRSMPVHMFGKLTQDLFKEMENMDSTVEVTDLMERWTLEAIGKAGFDFDFDAIADRDNNWVRIYNNIKHGISDPLFFMFPILEAKFLWMFPKRKLLHKDLEQFLGMIRNVIEDKRRKIENGENQNENLEENEKDLLTLMLESEMKGEGKMTNEELEANICVFFLAGHDTTANALSFALYYLAENPEIQQRAREEAISILGDNHEDIIPTVEDTKQMEYINQIMKETLRMNGPASTVVTRVSTEDSELAGSFIPKGTLLNVNIFDTHHSAKNWSDPLTFDPDRFATDRDEKKNSVQGSNWVPFGGGARQCIGMNFSLNEQRVMLSMLLKKFTWKLPKDSIHVGGVKTAGIGVISPKDLKIEFTKNY